MGFLTMLVSAALPAVIDGVGKLIGAVSRRVGGLSIDDQIKLEGATVERLKALAQLDAPVGTPSQWVVDLRAAFRYVAAIVVISIGAGALFLGLRDGNDAMIAIGADLVGAPFAFIFGERMLLGFKAVTK